MDFSNYPRTTAQAVVREAVVRELSKRPSFEGSALEAFEFMNVDRN